jgi:hypothetical protein
MFASQTRGQEGRVMAPKRRPSLDPKSFLAKVGEGRSIERFGKDQIVFSQGDLADAAFFIQKDKAKITFASKEAVVAIFGTNEGHDRLNVSNFAQLSPRQERSAIRYQRLAAFVSEAFVS